MNIQISLKFHAVCAASSVTKLQGFGTERVNGICYIGAYGMLSLLRCFRCYVVAKMIAIPIESCSFNPQNGGKSYPDVMSKLISVNCINQCVK